jgi:hypothetical protein
MMAWPRLRVVLMACCVLVSGGLQGAEFFVSLQGNAQGSGSREQPWSLTWALGHPSALKPGDIVWVLGGTYTGAFTSSIHGTSSAPIVVRALPGERVILDGNVGEPSNGVLNIHGSHAWFWGFEITNSATSGDNRDKDGVYMVGPGTKLIHCTIANNGGNGVGFWRPAVDAEIVGCVIYHNGYRGRTRGHGHGIYTQNESGTKLIRDNVFFQSFGNGIQVYTEGGSIQGYRIEGNTFFNAGIPGSGFIERNLIVGGLQPADRIHVSDNLFYNRPAFASKASVQFGYGVANQEASFINNTIIDGSFYAIKGWSRLEVRDNTLISSTSAMQLIGFDDYSNITVPVFDRNHYSGGTLDGLSFAEWRTQTGQDAQSSYSANTPSQTAVALRTSRYDPAIAHVIVQNWAGAPSVGVEVSAFLSPGEGYRLSDVQNLAGGAVSQGCFRGGLLEIPLTLNAIELPTDTDSYTERLVHTLPAFGVFLLERAPELDNRSPVLTPIGPKLIQVGKTLEIQAEGSDADSDALTFGANGELN